MKKLSKIILFFFVLSCGEIDFVYENKKNLINPLYEKTNVYVTGFDLPFINSYASTVFGNNKDNKFNLAIKVDEIKTKRSVESNQAASNLRYELVFLYILSSNEKNCSLYEKNIVSSFSIIPKSSGYNYGSDASLEKKYELAVTENLDRFISLVSSIDVNSCL